MFGQIDFEDAIAGGFFARASLVSTGIMAITFLPEDIVLSSAVWTVGGTNITSAFLIALCALAAAYTTNRVGNGSSDVQVDTDLADIAINTLANRTCIQQNVEWDRRETTQSPLVLPFLRCKKWDR